MAEKDKRYFWLKLKRDFFKRGDIQIIEALPNGKDYILFYLKLLCESVDNNGQLRFSEQIPYNEQMLSTITNTNVDIVRSAIKIFTELGMMEILDDGTFFMNEVERMLGSETYWAKQKRIQKSNKNKNVGNFPIESNKSPTIKSKSKSKSIDKELDIELDKELDTDLKSKQGFKKEKSKKNQLVNKRESDKTKEALEKIVELYNQICLSLPKTKILTEARKKKIKARLKTYRIEDFETAFKKMEASSFLRGENDRGWTANLNWLIDRDDNMAKVLEDSYIDRERKSKAAREQEEAFKMLAEWAEEDD